MLLKVLFCVLLIIVQVAIDSVCDCELTICMPTWTRAELRQGYLTRRASLIEAMLVRQPKILWHRGGVTRSIMFHVIMTIYDCVM